MIIGVVYSLICFLCIIINGEEGYSFSKTLIRSFFWPVFMPKILLKTIKECYYDNKRIN